MEEVRQQPKEGPEEIKQLITQLKNLVSDFPLFIETTLRPYHQSRSDTFQAGNISHSLDAWKEMTSDKDILSTVMGMSIQFCDKPIQHYPLKSVRSERETQIISAEINKLLSKGALEVTKHTSKACPLRVTLTGSHIQCLHR